MRAERRSWHRLVAALTELSEGHAQLLWHSDRPWASVTFSGTRHAMALLFEGSAAVDAGEAFIAALPEHEFTVPGQLVADAMVIVVEHELLPEPRLTVEVELLLLEAM